MSVIISDTSPLNYLVLIGHIAVLQKLFGRVIIPQAVFEELQDEETPREVREFIASRPEWIEVRSASQPPDRSLDFLDAGEREAIILAKELSAIAIIIDEEDGRNEARRRGLRVIGTLRVLYDAAEAGLCDLKETFDGLRGTTFHASERLYQHFLTLEAERKMSQGGKE